MVAPNVRDILDAAMKLSAEDRATIAEHLWDTVESETDDDLSPEWQKEIERRVESIKKGDAKLLDGEPILRALKEGRMP